MALRNKFQLLIKALTVNNQNRKKHSFQSHNDGAWEFKKLGPAEFALIKDQQIISICNLFGYKRFI